MKLTEKETPVGERQFVQVRMKNNPDNPRVIHISTQLAQ